MKQPSKQSKKSVKRPAKQTVSKDAAVDPFTILKSIAQPGFAVGISVYVGNNMAGVGKKETISTTDHHSRIIPQVLYVVTHTNVRTGDYRQFIGDSLESALRQVK